LEERKAALEEKNIILTAQLKQAREDVRGASGLASAMAMVEQKIREEDQSWKGWGNFGRGKRGDLLQEIQGTLQRLEMSLHSPASTPGRSFAGSVPGSMPSSGRVPGGSLAGGGSKDAPEEAQAARPPLDMAAVARAVESATRRPADASAAEVEPASVALSSRSSESRSSVPGHGIFRARTPQSSERKKVVQLDGRYESPLTERTAPTEWTVETPQSLSASSSGQLDARSQGGERSAKRSAISRIVNAVAIGGAAQTPESKQPTPGRYKTPLSALQRSSPSSAAGSPSQTSIR
jgi:hypothetical protein